MKKCRRGYTIVEVALFLALSGFLIAGIILGTNISINRQRYNDSVNDFAEYLRSVYSDVINVSSSKIPSSMTGSENAGRSDKAIYGKLIVLGDKDTNPSTIYTYTIVGDALSSSEIKNTGSLLEILQQVRAQVVTADSTTGLVEAYEQEEHILPWEATLQTPSGEQLSALIMIVRSPLSGTIHTYTLSEPNTSLLGYNKGIKDNTPGTRNLFTNLLSGLTSNNEILNTDICVQSEDNNYGVRRDVRINANASSSSAVNVMPLNGEDNPCR